MEGINTLFASIKIQAAVRGLEDAVVDCCVVAPFNFMSALLVVAGQGLQRFQFWKSVGDWKVRWLVAGGRHAQRWSFAMVGREARHPSMLTTPEVALWTVNVALKNGGVVLFAKWRYLT
jgi:hypothetical protein